jgi:hypothetical protein
MSAVTEEVCSDRKKVFEDFSLSAQTCARRIEKLGANLFEQLQIRAKSFECYSLAIDESYVIKILRNCWYSFVELMLPSRFLKN